MKPFPKLRGRIIEKFGSISNFANAVGIERTTVYSKLSNRRKFNREDMKKWGDVLGIPTEEYYDYYF